MALRDATRLQGDVVSEGCDNKVVVIDDAGDRLGAAIAHHLARAGARLVLGYREAAGRGVRELAHALRWDGAQALAVPAHAARPGHCAGLVSAALAHYGRFDLVLTHHIVRSAAAPERNCACHARLYGAAAAILYTPQCPPGRLVDLTLGAAVHDRCRDPMAAICGPLEDELAGYGIQATRIHVSDPDPLRWREAHTAGQRGAPAAQLEQAAACLARTIGLIMDAAEATRFDQIRIALG